MKKRGIIRVGKARLIDTDVVLGHPSGRLAKRSPLVLGVGAYLRSGTILYEATTIGKNFETGHRVIVREENTVGDDVQIWSNAIVDYGCRIGDRVKIHSQSYVSQFSVLEDDAFLAPGVILANDLYPGRGYSKEVMRGPRIGKGAQIGVNATVLPYVSIGAGAIVGAGAVVTKDVPPRSVVWGNPARIHKKTTEIDNDLKELLRQHMKI